MKTIIKFISTLLIFFMPIIVLAEDSNTLTIIGNDEVVVDNDISISLKLKSNEITKIDTNIKYDEKYFEYIETNLLDNSLTCDTKQNDSIIKISCSSNDTYTSDNNEIIKVKFKAIKSGTTKIETDSVELLINNETNVISNDSKTIKIKKNNVISTMSSKSDDATLKSLNTSTGLLTPAFSPTTYDYTMSVEGDVESIDLNANANHSNATLSGTGTKNLVTGTNIVTVKVIAEDGSTSKEYKIIITKNPLDEEEVPDPTPNDTRSSDNNLKSLEVENYDINPSFDPNITNYTLTVENDVTNLNVNATSNDSNATYQISNNEDLKEGINNIRIRVIAEDGSVKNYIISVTRKNGENKIASFKSTNNSLSSLIVVEGILSQDFDSGITSYNITIPSDVDKLNILYKTVDPKTNVEIVGNEDFVIGKRKDVDVKVIAEDGSEKIYTINVYKSDKESNNKLANLTILNGNLIPSFDKNTYEYEVTIPFNIDKIDVNATSNNSNCSIEVLNNENLKIGNNIVLVKVTDENGFIRFYKLNVNKNLNIVIVIIVLIICSIMLYLFIKKNNKKRKK